MDCPCVAAGWDRSRPQQNQQHQHEGVDDCQPVDVHVGMPVCQAANLNNSKSARSRCNAGWEVLPTDSLIRDSD